MEPIVAHATWFANMLCQTREILLDLIVIHHTAKTEFVERYQWLVSWCVHPRAHFFDEQR